MMKLPVFPSILLVAAAAPHAQAAERLANDHVRAELDDRGLTSFTLRGEPTLRMTEVPVSLKIDGATISAVGSPRITRGQGKVTYAYASEGYGLEVVYELRPTWRFVSKQIRVSRPGTGTGTGRYTVESVDALHLRFAGDVKVRNAGGASAFLIEPTGGRTSYFAVQQNPFPVSDTKEGLKLGYAPAMEWRTEYGPFESDRICIGAAKTTGHNVAMPTVREWEYIRDPAASITASPQIDRGAYDAIRACVDAFVISPRPKESLKVHIPWCENDYQIDLADPNGPPQYERIIDQAKAIGSDYVLFTPQNSFVSKRTDSNDAWAWESLLWLGYGPKIRKGEWDIEKGPIHPSVQHFLDYAKKRDVKLLTYIYPSLAWTQNPEWTAWAGEAKLPLGGYVGADTGVRSFQDWLVDSIVKFCDRTGVAGVSFDHWWIAYDKASSRYSQWHGCRRILEELRRRKPDILIDGRQQYHQFGAWTWLGGSYPHPTANDEQPISFRANADLHTDRVSANHQRFASYWFTVRNFTPPILNPGYLTHQTQRNTLKGFTTENFRLKDWDVRGWRYSVLSSVGTAPYNSVVSMIPARDTEEFKAFSASDQKWFAEWMRWPDTHRGFIRNTRPILGQPMMGKVDGTSMIDGDKGYVFLFNPNYRTMTASFALDGEIGLDKGREYTVRQIEPDARPIGTWRRGERVEIPMDGTSAIVLEIAPAGNSRPLTLLNANGTVALRNGVLQVTGIRGEVGSKQELLVSLPSRTQVREAQVNGKRVGFTVADGQARLDVTFEGERFAPAHAVLPYDRDFAGTSASGSFRIPAWVRGQLARAKAAWPVTYTEDDLIAPWLGQDRLLLFVQIADANDKMAVSMTIDGQPVPVKKAYNSIYPESVPGTFIGFYADVASLATGVDHRVEVTLPDGLKPGQFQGLFFDNVERETTDRVIERR